MRSIRLRTEPTVRQTRTILGRIERELTERGAQVTHTATSALRFTMPAPWRTGKLDALVGVTAGVVAVSAGAGEPRRVRYKLRYTALQAAGVVTSLALVAAGWQWSRVALLNALLALWVLVFGILYVLADTRFRRLLERAAREVVDRNDTPREILAQRGAASARP